LHFYLEMYVVFFSFNFHLSFSRFPFHSVLAILLGSMALCLEVGLPAVVNLTGPQRHHWYNNYAVRGIYFFLMGVLTLPDSNWSW